MKISLIKIIFALLIIFAYIQAENVENAVIKEKPVTPAHQKAQCSLKSPVSGCPDYFICQQDLTCKHKGLFPPKKDEFFGFIILFVAGIMASITGIAGGEFFVPTFVQIYKFDIKVAIQASVFLISGTQLLTFAIAYKVRRQKKNQPIIDYTLAAILAPCLFLGTLLGVPLNIMMPQWLLLVLFTLLMIYNFQKSLKSAFVMYKKEAQPELHEPIIQQQQCLKEDLPSTTDDEIELQDMKENHSFHSNYAKNSNQSQPLNKDLVVKKQFFQTKSQQILHDILTEEAKPIWFKRVKYLLICLAAIVTVNLLKGSSRVPSIIGVTQFSFIYWIIFLSYVPFSLYLLSLLVKELDAEYKLKKSVGYRFDITDLQYNKQTITTLCIIGFIIGIFAALIGIGGGVILTPFLISWKVQADIVSYTSAFIAFIGSTSNLCQFMLYAQIQWDYAIISLIICYPAFYIGLKVILAYIVSKNKRSYIVFTLTVIIVGATLSILLSGIKNIMQDYRLGKDIWSFQSLK